MKNLAILAILLSVGSSCTSFKGLFKKSEPVKSETVKFGILSQTNEKQDYEEFFLKVDGKPYTWKIDEPGKKTVKRINLEKGEHEYELTVKSLVQSSSGPNLIMGTSSGKLNIETDKDLKLSWDKKLQNNVYKISLK